MKILFAVLVACGLAPVASAQTTFHGDNARSGVYPTAGPAKFGGIRWTFKASGPIVGSAAIAAGTVYVGDYGGHLHAIDQQTGKEKWNFKSSMPIASSPAVTDKAVYFVSSAGALVALDPVTGKPRWVFVAEYEKKFEAKNLHGYAPAAQTIPDAWDLYISSPAVAQGKVFFGSGDGGVYAVDAESGVLQWKFSTGDVVHASPAVANGTVYIGSWDGNLYAIDADSGRQRWVFKGGQDPAIHNQVGFQSSPAVVDGVVYVGCRDAHVYAIDANTGVKKWDYPTSKSWVNGTPAVRDGIVYVGTADSSRFMALDARTGRLRFNFDARSYVFSSAVRDRCEKRQAAVGVSDRRCAAKHGPHSESGWQPEPGCIRARFRRLPGHVCRFLSLHADRRDHGLTGCRQRCRLHRQHGWQFLCAAIALAANDDPRAARVGQIGPGPVEQHHESIAEADQKEDVRCEPEAPGEHSGQFQSRYFDHCGAPPDGGQQAEIAIAERGAWAAGETRGNGGRGVRTHLLGRRRNARHGPAIADNGSKVTDDEDFGPPCK
jgi:outer membrane protein assembly factor BamB